MADTKIEKHIHIYIDKIVDTIIIKDSADLDTKNIKQNITEVLNKAIQGYDEIQNPDPDS